MKHFSRTAHAAPGVFLITLAMAGAVAAQMPHEHDARALREDPRLAAGQIAPVLEGLGDLHHAVTTTSGRAQLFFDQGLRLTFAFNHAEALRSFKEAARLDPDCAMAYWGWALVLGPNLNLPMRPEVVAQAHEAIQRAVALRNQASEAERAYIDALETRYTEDPQALRAPLDLAYAEAMASLSRRYPDDDDAATLYAAALMNVSPWNYWAPDGKPRGRTGEILRSLETVLARHPGHIGALHYYIHAVEAAHPAGAETAADRLRGQAPGAGHLVHMPSHIYMQVGRYSDAFDANVRASRADEEYITQCRAQGIYPLNYYPHNLHFLAWAAMMEGRSAEAVAAARKVSSHVPADRRGDDWALYQTFLSMPLTVMTRFGMWQEILAEPAPPAESSYWRGIWHYARGLARLRTGRPDEARRELEEVRRIAAASDSAKTLVGFSDGRRLLSIARDVLAGEIAASRQSWEEAIARMDRAARIEGALTYEEPPGWIVPVRHHLGAVLLEAGRPEEAEVVFWQDLRRYPENGYSLSGLARALRNQGRTDEAGEMEERARRAWARSDVRITSSRF
jgi:tetratricopeptide (TPR) repeat protein